MQYPYVKCHGCKKRVMFPIEIPDNARLEYESKKGVKFHVKCLSCGLEDTYRAKEVHFSEIVLPDYYPALIDTLHKAKTLKSKRRNE